MRLLNVSEMQTCMGGNPRVIKFAGKTFIHILDFLFSEWERKRAKKIAQREKELKALEDSPE